MKNLTNSVLRRLEQQQRTETTGTSCLDGLDIARYPKNVLVGISYQYAAAYEAAGGNYDRYGCWGFAPSDLAKFETAGYPAETIALIPRLLGRVDYCDVAAFVQLYNDYKFNTAAQYYTLLRGKKNIEFFADFGIEFKKCCYSAAKFDTEQKRWSYAAANCSKWSELLRRVSIDHNGEYVVNIKEGCVYLDYPSNMFKKLVQQYFAAQERSELRKSASRTRGVQIGNASLFVKYLEQGIYVRCFGVSTLDATNHTTSKGVIYKLRNSLLNRVLEIREGKRIASYYNYPSHKISGLNAAKVGSTYFVWAQDFSLHIEGVSLKGSVRKYQLRQKKAGGIICLNDVRNDVSGTAGYCLYGVKSFAAAKMPFLAALLAPYSNWCEVPSDILAAEFTPLKQIFEGYSNPFA